MSVLMKNSPNKVLLFPAPPQEAESSPIIVQIGGDRFAIHFQIQDLPPAPPLLLRTRGPGRANAKTSRVRSLIELAIPHRQSKGGVDQRSRRKRHAD
jgi:hypothetical protein